jgi:hypothetical protein
MIICRQRIREAKLFHHHKTHAIRERKLMMFLNLVALTGRQSAYPFVSPA